MRWLPEASLHGPYGVIQQLESLLVEIQQTVFAPASTYISETVIDVQGLTFIETISSRDLQAIMSSI